MTVAGLRITKDDGSPVPDAIDAGSTLRISVLAETE